MKTVKQGKIHYMQPGWAAQDKLLAGFTTRNGGSSRPPYNSLNLGYGSGDQQSQVEANRTAVARSFGVEPHLFLTVKQVHGSEILVIDQSNPEVSHFQRVESDAIITNQKNTPPAANQWPIAIDPLPTKSITGRAINPAVSPNRLSKFPDTNIRLRRLAIPATAKKIPKNPARLFSSE